jgi:conjugative transfer pilus assembly protein TraH
MKKIHFILFCFISSTAFASVSNDLGSFFNHLGYTENATNPTAYQGQSAGFYTGGSLYARDTVRNYQLLSVNLPSVTAGCGGIDAFTGSFSFINSDELVNAMKNVANNAVSYAFMLGLETMTPEIANEMEYFQTMANRVNQMNIQSCESAASLVGAVWPKTDIAQQQVCETLGSSNNIFSDFAQAKQGCGTGIGGKSRTNTLNDLKNNDNDKDLVLQNTNIAWQAVLKNGFLESDKELGELFMSLSGSIIIKSGNNDREPNEYAVLSSLSSNQNLIKAILYGGTTQIYICDETKNCLNPTLKNITIAPEQGLASQVRKYLDAIYQKILTDTPLTNDEKGFLQSTSLPIYKMLNVESAYANGADILDLDNEAEVIATDILDQYLTENLDIIQKSASVLQYPENIMATFEQGMIQARDNVGKMRTAKMQDFNATMQLIERTQLLEQQLAGELSTRLSKTMTWAQGLE